MNSILTQIIKKSLDSPDEVRSHPKLKVDVVKLGEFTVMRATFQPGWRWSKDLKPIIGTESCETAHLGVLLSGRLATKMNDGSEIEGQAGDVVDIPPGHDGWVVGDEPAVFLDFVGGETYARSSEIIAPVDED